MDWTDRVADGVLARDLGRLLVDSIRIQGHVLEWHVDKLRKEKMRTVVLTSPPWGTNQGSDASRDFALNKEQLTDFVKGCCALEAFSELVSVHMSVCCTVMRTSGWSETTG